MFRFLRVNMATKACVFEDIPQEYAGLGGRALTSTIVAREVPPTCTPLGPHNKLVFAPGLLGATNSPNSNRLSVGCKSPLTEGIKESNAGGQPGGHLAKLGILAIIVEDMAKEGEWWQLEIDKDSAKLVPCEIAGLNNFAAVEKLVEKFGKECSYITIGRAGEFKLTAASIACTDRELRPMRHAGRGGVGAVMGSKGLKAIVVNPANGANHPLEDEKAFREASKRFAKALTTHPICGTGLAEYGTAVLVNILHEAGGLPTANFTVGQFDGHEAVSGEKLNALTKERGGEGSVAHGCMSGCIIRCSGLLADKKGKFQSKWPEYETLWAFGPHSGIDDLDARIRKEIRNMLQLPLRILEADAHARISAVIAALYQRIRSGQGRSYLFRIREAPVLLLQGFEFGIHEPGILELPQLRQVIFLVGIKLALLLQHGLQLRSSSAQLVVCGTAFGKQGRVRAEIVQQRKLEASFGKEDAPVLGMYVDKPGGEPLERGQLHGAVVDEAARPARGIYNPADGQVAGGTHVEFGLDHAGLRAFGNHRSVGPGSEKQRQGAEQYGLSRAGLTGNNDQTLRKFYIQRVYEYVVFDVQGP